MDTKKIIQDLNNSLQKFEKEKHKDAIITNLQILSSTDDLSVFETNSWERSELFVNLYELLTNHSTDPELVWCVVTVLGVAANNPNTRTILVHTYHFIQPLTTLLDSELTKERKSTLLNIIQELSFGVVISWQEAYLPKLLCLLTDLVMDEDDQLTPLALGVLVNLLHNNKPAIHTLMDCVNIKKLIRKSINLQRDNVETSVQVCKLLMVLDQLSGNVPDAEILTFIRVSFMRINKAFKCGNEFLMRHIVHFFRDAKESKNGRKVFLAYTEYPEVITKLIDTLESKETEDWQCVQQLVDFLQLLVDLELPAVVPLFTSLTQCFLRWLQVDSVVPAVLQLFSAMLHQSRHKDEQEYKNICACLETQLQMFIEMLHDACKADTKKSQVRDLLVGLLHLFHELTENFTFCSVITAQVDKELIKNLLLPLVTINTSDENQLFQHPLSVLCVEVLNFVSELSLDDKEWLFLYAELLQKKQILKVLAISLYSGSYEVKRKILYLAGTTSFSKECLTGLSKYLTDLNQLFLLSPPGPVDLHHEKNDPSPKSQIHFSPRFSQQQNESLNGLIEKLEDLYSKNKLQEASLSGIIELFNYKLAEMHRAERSLQSSLESADRSRTQMSHRVSQLSAETDRLRQLLYSSQQCVESYQAEANVLHEQLRAAQGTANSSDIKFKQLKQDIRSKSLIIKEQTEKRAELEEQVEKLKQSITNIEAEKSDLKAANTKVQEKLLEKEMMLGKKTTQVQTLEQEISRQLGVIKGLEKTIKEKDKELQELEKTRKLIFEISAKKPHS